MIKVLGSSAEAIGKTPLVRLDRLTKFHNVKGTILAKLEYLNPGFSKKDRSALGIIEEAEKSGILAPGQTVVELTSGNMGTGLAIVCSVKGYPFIAVMSKGNSEERARMMRSLGAEVVLVDQLPESTQGQVSGGDLDLVDKVAKKITQDRQAFRADQFNRDGNWLAHYKDTTSEIWEATGGKLDGFADFLGSGGTYKGVAKGLKEFNSAIQCFVIEPEGAAPVAKKTVTNPNHPIQGGGYNMSNLKFLDGVPIDGFIQISGKEAQKTTRELAKHEGIFSGFSSGANVTAALKLLSKDMAGKTIVVMICDSGLKYLSTDLWNE
tara:strand:- start:2820 stop:3785 length:966 start_codon:yes stop_codon:yes gene_type:complete